MTPLRLVRALFMLAMAAAVLSGRYAHAGIGSDIPVIRDTASDPAFPLRGLLSCLLFAAICGVAWYWLRRRRLPALSMAVKGTPGNGVRRVNRLQLNGKVALEAVEFDGRTLLLAVTDNDAREIARSDAPRATVPEADGHA